MQNVVTFDVETTTKAKGSPFNQDNSLVMIQLKVNNEEPVVFSKENFKDALPILESASVVCGFNIKFDCHWLQRELGAKLKAVWDCQLAEFLLSNQQNKYPNLADTCIKYGASSKLDIIKDEYWAKGVETTEIPWEILAEYGKQDVQSTYEVFLKQVELFKGDEQHKFKLFRLQCNDLLVLQEMEFNGIIYDEQGSLAESKNLDKQIKLLEDKISVFTSNVPVNLDSRDHISVLLYGGTITNEIRLPIGIYKTGAKAGQTRYKIVPREYELPRLVAPLKGSELKKEGFYGTDEPTLLSLKPNAQAKRLITWLLERSKIMKLKSTYLEGLPKIIRETGWMPNHLHSNLNQCTTKTGRLSSTKPNQQNLNPEAKRFCITRYGN
jgi:DNA polymerase-1